jgi:DNA-directed RNA polymerase specialized sigma24 family protein
MPDRRRLTSAEEEPMAFERPARSAAEIAALPELGTTEFGAFVRANGATFCAETLVYLARRAHADRDTAMLDHCCRLLIGHEVANDRISGGHCEGVIVNLSRHFGFFGADETRREFKRRCYTALWKEICRGGGMLEHRFGLRFKSRCIDVANLMIRAKLRSADSASAAEYGEEPIDVDGVADDEAVTIEDYVLTELARPTHEKILLQALRRLPTQQAHAAFLAWIEEIPKEGDGPNTVASIMGISPTAVYKLLRKARKTLQADPAVRAIRFGEA